VRPAAEAHLRDSWTPDEPNVRKAVTRSRVLVVAERLKYVERRDRVVTVELGSRAGETPETPIPRRMLASLTTSDPVAVPNANGLAANGSDRFGLLDCPQIDARLVRIGAAGREARDQGEPRGYLVSPHTPKAATPAAESPPRASARVARVAPHDLALLVHLSGLWKPPCRGLGSRHCVPPACGRSLSGPEESTRPEPRSTGRRALGPRFVTCRSTTRPRHRRWD
jgi:hypothetical protein